MEVVELKHKRLLKHMRKAYGSLLRKKLISADVRDDLVQIMADKAEEQ